MATDLPSEFDVIVLGTGMPESIAAAAFSRIGQSVLHLDRNEYYSGSWASFNLQGIEDWARHHKEGRAGLQRPSVDESSFLGPDEILVQLPLNNSNFTDINLTFYVEEGEDEEPPDKKGTGNVSIPSDGQKDVKGTGNASIPSDGQKDVKGTGNVSIPSDGQKDVKGTGNASIPSDGQKDVKGTGNASIPSDGQKEVVSEQEQLNTENSNLTIETEELIDTTSIDKNTTNDQDTSKAIENMILNTDNIPKADIVQNDCKLQDSSALSANNDKSDVLDHKDKSLETLNDQKGSENDDNITLNDSKEENKKKEWTIKRLKAEWRKFNLDLSPKVLYSGGDMVELLISSDIAKYCEFQTVTRLLTLLNGKLEKVPCSRADVFSSKKVSMIEKRMLMKFLQFCVESENKQDEIQDFLQKPFTEFLAHRRLTPNVKHYIEHSIAMATESTTTEQGLLQMKKFLKSVGRYGNTAFLWSLYGSGELPQSFCRMCAVFGGLYCLRMSASSIIVNKENRCVGIVTTEGQRIRCKWLILESSYAPAHYIDISSSRSLSRAILMTDKPLLPTDQQELSLMCLPCPDDDDRPIFVLELPPTCLACPKDTYIFHLTREAHTCINPEENLSYAVEKLFKNDTDSGSDNPSILWSAFFTQCDSSGKQPTDELPLNIILMSGPGSEIDIDWPVREAKEVFHKILPDEEFLPKAPNPEDIIYVDDTATQVVEESNQEEFKDTESVQSDCIYTENKEPTLENTDSQPDTKTTETNQSDVKATDN